MMGNLKVIAQEVNITSNEVKKENKIDLEDLMADLHKYLDRICFLLSEWLEDYDFSEKPDPRAAIASFKGEVKDMHSEQSVKWFYEYNRIRNLVDMSVDYAIDAKKLIEQEGDM